MNKIELQTYPDGTLNESGERWGIYWLEEVEAQDQVDGDRA